MAGKAKIVVEYDDGSVETFNPNRPRLLLDMEQKFGVQSPETHEHMTWLAHRALARDKKFDEWLDTVADLEFDAGEQTESGEKPGEAGPS